MHGHQLRAMTGLIGLDGKRVVVDAGAAPRDAISVGWAPGLALNPAVADHDEFLHLQTANDILQKGRLFTPNLLLPVSQILDLKSRRPRSLSLQDCRCLPARSFCWRRVAWRSCRRSFLRSDLWPSARRKDLAGRPRRQHRDSITEAQPVGWRAASSARRRLCSGGSQVDDGTAVGVYFDGGAADRDHSTPLATKEFLKVNDEPIVGRPFDNGYQIIFDVRKLDVATLTTAPGRH